jgi:uncharacterized repeat protein (TIGR01451 family)
MNAWSGGAYDTHQDRLLIWGGGHNDYGGNEIYAFDVNTLSWSRIWGPSPDIPEAGGPCSETYADGNPVSRHTYDGLAYLPAIDAFWSNGGSLFCGAGNGTFATWVFDLTSMVWTQVDDVPVTGYSTGLSDTSAYDSQTGHVFHMGTRTFSEYDPGLGSWTVRGEASEGWWGSATAAIDPVRRLFVRVGNGSVRNWNLQTWERGDPITTGGVAVIDPPAPGFAYDPVDGQFLGWNGGTDVFRLDVETWTWTQLPLAPDNTVIPTDPPSAGVYGKFQVIPSYHALIAVNSIYENVYLYKLPSGNEPAVGLALSKTASPDPAVMNQPLTYTLSVTNHGPLTDTNVLLTDTLPLSVTLGSYTSTQGGCIPDDGTLACSLGGLLIGEQVTVTLTVTPTAFGLIHNLALVAGEQPDPNPADNTAMVETYVFEMEPRRTYMPLIVR